MPFSGQVFPFPRQRLLSKSQKSIDKSKKAQYTLTYTLRSTKKMEDMRHEKTYF